MGLTQEELSAKTGLSVRTIRNLETRPGCVPRQSTVRLLAEAFGLRGADREQFYRQSSGGREPPAPDSSGERAGYVRTQIGLQRTLILFDDAATPSGSCRCCQEHRRAWWGSPSPDRMGGLVVHRWPQDTAST
jgi:hypothetical protein